MGQYFSYLKNMVTVNWGVSIGGSLGEPVTKMIGQAMPWTLGLVGVTTVMAFLLGTLFGILAGWKRGGLLDGVVPPVFVVTSALPYFWVALLFIVLFANGAHALLPNDGNFDIGLRPGWSSAFITSVLKTCGAAGRDDPDHGYRRLDPDHAQHDDHDACRGLRADGSRQRVVEPPHHDGLRRAQCVPAEPVGLRDVARLRDQPARSSSSTSSTIPVSATCSTPRRRATDYPLLQALFLLVTIAVLVCVLICDFAVFLLDPRARAKG